MCWREAKYKKEIHEHTLMWVTEKYFNINACENKYNTFGILTAHIQSITVCLVRRVRVCNGRRRSVVALNV